MAREFSDTSPEAERVQIELLRAMPEWRKFQLLDDLIVTSRELALAGLRERYPDASPEELRRRLATLLLGPDLAARVYGPEPDPPTFR
jgi:hypothetical protein